MNDLKQEIYKTRANFFNEQYKKLDILSLSEAHALAFSLNKIVSNYINQNPELSNLLKFTLEELYDKDLEYLKKMIDLTDKNAD